MPDLQEREGGRQRGHAAGPDARYAVRTGDAAGAGRSLDRGRDALRGTRYDARDAAGDAKRAQTVCAAAGEAALMKEANAWARAAGWLRLLNPRRAWLSGTVAGLCAAAAAAYCARREGSTACAPINAVTHSLWPQRAVRERGFSVRHTVLGLGIHQAAAVFWALMFERIVPRAPRADPAGVAVAAAATAATAYCVDYHVVPERLTPGFEAHLGPRSMTCVYVGIAVGLAAVALLRRPQD